MAISSQIVSLFHKNGLKSSLLKQIDHFKNVFYLKFNFKHDKKKRFYKKALYFSKCMNGFIHIMLKSYICMNLD